MDLVGNRDIVVVGASAGGVEPLRVITAGLDSDIPAAIFVVMHLPSDRPSALADILARHSALPVLPASDGHPIERGTVTVAIPGHHLSLEKGKTRVLKGPSENRHRPSVDVLFRSAARFYGERVIGVVLSGALDDGTAGLIAVKLRGGLAVVQDPSEAFSADMPRNAMHYMEVDHVLPSGEIASLLNALAREPVSAADGAPPTREMEQEDRIARIDLNVIEDDEKPGTNSVVACPDCHGVLWEIQEGNLLRFRCRVGHAYSPESLIAASDDGLEKALWEALRTLEERVALRRRLVSQARERRLEALAAHFEQRLGETQKNVETIRNLLVRRERHQGIE